MTGMTDDLKAFFQVVSPCSDARYYLTVYSHSLGTAYRGVTQVSWYVYALFRLEENDADMTQFREKLKPFVQEMLDEYLKALPNYLMGQYLSVDNAGHYQRIVNMTPAELYDHYLDITGSPGEIECRIDRNQRDFALYSQDNDDLDTNNSPAATLYHLKQCLAGEGWVIDHLYTALANVLHHAIGYAWYRTEGHQQNPNLYGELLDKFEAQWAATFRKHIDFVTFYNVFKKGLK